MAKYTVIFHQVLIGETEVEAESWEQAEQLAYAELDHHDFIEEVDQTYVHQIIGPGAPAIT